MADYKGVFVNGDMFDAIMEGYVDPSLAVPLGTYESEIEAAQRVSVALELESQYVDDVQFADLADTEFNSIPPSLKEFARDRVQLRSEFEFQNVVATQNGANIDLTFDLPVDSSNLDSAYISVYNDSVFIEKIDLPTPITSPFSFAHNAAVGVVVAAKLQPNGNERIGTFSNEVSIA
jgi:hypothetical protein